MLSDKGEKKKQNKEPAHLPQSKQEIRNTHEGLAASKPSPGEPFPSTIWAWSYRGDRPWGGSRSQSVSSGAGRAAAWALRQGDPRMGCKSPGWDLRAPEGCTELAPQGIAPLVSRKLWAAGTGANTTHGCSRRSLGKEHAAFRL